jgi:HEPN domain-containing protein
MSAERLIASLLRVANEDFEGARVLAASGNRNAVYLYEQAAEKLIRAVLTSENLHAGIKHQLDEMVDQLPDANTLKPKLRAIEHLSAYATSYRYPAPGGRIKASPSSAKLEEIATAVRSVLDEAIAHFGVDPARDDTPARSSRPPR